MIAYVDENGMITSVPPELRQRGEINQEDILISTPKKEDMAPVILRGRVDYFNVVDGISVNDIVTFDLERGDRGLSAVNVCLENK